MNQLPNIAIVATHLDKNLPSICTPTARLQNRLRQIPTPVARVAVEGVQPKTDTLEAVIAEQARTIARLVTLLEAAATTQIPAGGRCYIRDHPESSGKRSRAPRHCTASGIVGGGINRAAARHILLFTAVEPIVRVLQRVHDAALYRDYFRT